MIIYVNDNAASFSCLIGLAYSCDHIVPCNWLYILDDYRLKWRKRATGIPKFWSQILSSE